MAANLSPQVTCLQPLQRTPFIYTCFRPRSLKAMRRYRLCRSSFVTPQSEQKCSTSVNQKTRKGVPSASNCIPCASEQYIYRDHSSSTTFPCLQSCTYRFLCNHTCTKKDRTDAFGKQRVRIWSLGLSTLGSELAEYKHQLLGEPRTNSDICIHHYCT